MPATTIGTTGTVFGLTEESNLLLQSYNQTAQTEKAEVRDEVGDVVAVGSHNLNANGSMDAYTAGTFLVTAGQTLASLANFNTKYGGVTTGTVYVDSVAVNKTNTDFQRLTINFTRYPQI